MISERKVIESILLLADEPVPARVMGELLKKSRVEVEAVLQELASDYEDDDRGFLLREVAGGWRLYTSPECAPWLERFVLGHSHARLTPAALEVLAIVAYRGPLSRSQIADARGIDSDGVVRNLAHRGLIEEAGHERGPGAPTLFRVTDEFVERMGLRSLEELPPLADFMPTSEEVEDMEAKLSPNV